MTTAFSGQSTYLKEVVSKLRKNKAALYKRMTLQASDPEMIKYYAEIANDLCDVDLRITE